MLKATRPIRIGSLILATMFVLGWGKASVDRQAVHRCNDIGVAYMEQHNYYAASQEFGKALELDSDYAIGRINLGIAYYALSMYAEADAEFEKALALDPKNPYAYFNLGLVSKVQGEYEQAGKAFEEVLKVDSDDPFVHYNSGIVFSKQGRHAEAIRAYRRVIALDPNNVSAYYNLAGELRRAKKPEESKQVLALFTEKRASGLNPTVGVRYLEQGKYAEAIVDRAHRAEAEAGDHVIPVKFVDATAQAGLNRGQESGVRGQGQSEIRNPKSEIIASRSAVAFGDYDGDGDPDVYWVRCAASEAASANVLYRNNGDGTFTDVTEETGVGDSGMGMACAFGDYDNDGDRDLYVANYGPNVLYQNNGDGTFIDVTQEAGVEDRGMGEEIRNPQSAIRNPKWSMGCAFGDYDHDGDIDLYVANYGDLKGRGQSNTLLRNNGNGTFADVTAQVDVGNGARRSVAVLFTDFDNDRDVDMYVVNDGEPNALYSNNRDGTFTEVAALAGIADAGHSRVVAGGDYNKDDRMDLLMASRDGSDILYRNSKDRTFSQDPVLSERTAELKGNRIGGFFDYDNDGDLDIFVLSATKNLLLRNRGDGTFADASEVFGERKGEVRDVALGDYDDDGDVDLLLADGEDLTLLRNDGGNANHWLKIRLAGVGCNKDGIGTKVLLKAGPVWQKLEARATSQRSLELTFGVGKAEKVEMVRILWPGGVRQAELDVEADQTLEVTELDRKGTSCPMLYAWDGSRFEFITDFLGMAATGEFLIPGEYAYPDVDEYIKIEGAQLKPQDGVYQIRIATQLEEIALIDQVRLIAVDHPSEVDVVPNEKAAFSGAYPEFKLYTVRDLRPPVAAHDDRGKDILPLILEQDRTYPAGFELLPLKGYAEMHHIVLDLGDLSGAERISFFLRVSK
jgi:Flp pilus assembly protein TadD